MEGTFTDLPCSYMYTHICGDTPLQEAMYITRECYFNEVQLCLYYAHIMPANLLCSTVPISYAQKYANLMYAALVVHQEISSKACGFTAYKFVVQLLSGRWYMVVIYA